MTSAALPTHANKHNAETHSGGPPVQQQDPCDKRKRKQ